MTKHLLGMVAIVKDEAANVERLLASVKPLFDTYTIVDTGSSDDTVKLLTDALPPGSVHERPWVNFSHNLNEALVLAKGTADWLMRVDADQTLTFHPHFAAWLAEQSLEDAYNVEIREGEWMWRLPRLMKGDLDWEFKGATHEYLDTTGRLFRDLAGLTIWHHADGGSRANKFQRDVGLLQDGYLKGDPRSTFYLAESYKNLGQDDLAFDLYVERAEMLGTWEEEAWFAHYQAALCAVRLGKPEAPEMLVNAYNRRPTRGEPLKALREWCAANVPPVPTDSLFVDLAAHAS